MRACIAAGKLQEALAATPNLDSEAKGSHGRTSDKACATMEGGARAKEGALLRAIWRAHRLHCALVGLHSMTFLCFKMGTPFAFWWLLEGLKDDSEISEPLPRWHLWAASLLLPMLGWGISIFVASSTYRSTEFALSVRQAMSVFVFDAILDMPAFGSDIGAISSALTLDVDRIFLTCNESNFVWISVGMIVAGSIVLLVEVRVAAIVSILFLIGAQELQRRIQKRIRKTRKDMTAWTDRRVGLSAQLVHGMRPIRMNGWDPALRQQIEALREKELSILRRVQAWKAVNFALNSFVPALCTALVMATLAILEGPEKATPERFFVVISVVNPCIRTGMDMLNRGFNNITEAGVAIKRIERLALGRRSGWLARSAPLLPGIATQASDTSASPANVVCDTNAGTDAEPLLFELHAACFAWPGA